ncbi:TniB family NTP-binding protein [Bradyrhizobium jicamae]|uniref:TniB family NTP-binding protein n=1 Tax=Bradyrhizobium jicamae TaxID=280332 RepID=UPI001BA63E8E|nr:TniB family NTP-binding protein [Bradyrhizobium jicamae]MBR0752913.1 TniB family NTP-binding protein [Bradyrhizobium jicamae]
MSRRKPQAKPVVDDDISDRLASLTSFLTAEDGRVAAVMAKLETTYVRSNRDERIAVQIKRLIANAVKKRFPRKPLSGRNRRAGVGFAVVGESGSGKTEALEVAFAEHPAFPGYGEPGSGCILVSVLAPGSCTLGQLGYTILEELGYEPESDSVLRENEVWKRVRAQLRAQKILFLHIDDFGNVLHQASKKELKKIRDTLRNLMISRIWPVHLILSGTDEIVAVTKGDRQLSRRLKYVVFEDLVPEDDTAWIADVVASFAKAVGLKLVAKPEEELVPRLRRAAALQMGLVIEILLEAITLCVEGHRRTIGRKDFAEAYAERTMQPEALNMFLSPNWMDLDPSVILEDEEEEEPSVGPSKNVRKTTRKF